MSLDSSLKTGAGLNRHRNVLTRSERLVRLLGQGRMKEDAASVMGMPKVGHRKISVGKKSGKKADEAGATPGAAATPAAGAAKKAGAPAAKAAAPAAKAAAPAAKAAPAKKK